MDWIKKHWYIIVIIILVIFGMNKCASSCTNSNNYQNSEKTRIELVQKHDSIQKVLTDSIVILNTRIQVYEEKIAGLSQSLSIQEEANKRISEAKKNISINVKKVE